MTAMGSDGREWAVEHGVTVVVCPDCAFAFDAVHTDPSSDTYTCPTCPGNRR